MKILEGECVGCGGCLELCPQEAIKIHPRGDKAYASCYIDKDLCANCGLCVNDFECPGDAIVEDDFKEEE